VLPILIGRIDQGWRTRARFTYGTIAHCKSIMEYVIERVMLGSDYCFTMGNDQPVRFLDQVDLGPEQRTMILSGNASRRLKLQKPEQH